MMTRRKTIVVFRVNDSPVCTNSPELLAAWRLRLCAMRRGYCLRCHAHVRFLAPSQRAAYHRLGKTAPVLLSHNPHCPASDLAIRDAIQAGWS